MIQLQQINFPKDCKVTNHNFYIYDPEKNYNEAASIAFLNEDILQCSFPLADMIVDLGWYGNVKTNEGEFRIYLIQSENWEFPFNIIHSKSVEETKTLLTKILEYYTKTEYTAE